LDPIRKNIGRSRGTNKGRSLDEFIRCRISNNIKIPHAGVQRLDNSSISDHSGTYVYIYFNYPDNKTYQRRVWNYKRADYMKLNDLINNYDWSVLNPLDTNLATRTFTNIFMTMIKQCIPNYLVTIRTDDKPWYNNELRKHSRQRDRTKKIATISGKIFDWNKYKTLRNKVNNMKKHAKIIFFNNLEESLTTLQSNNQKQYWQTVKLLIKGNKSSNQDIPPLQNNDQSFSLTDEDKANTLNYYFSLISSLNDSDHSLPVFCNKSNSTITRIEINETEVIDILGTLEFNKSSGPDQISHRMLRETKYTICKPLTIFFNKSLAENIYPSDWKLAHVMPLF